MKKLATFVVAALVTLGFIASLQVLFDGAKNAREVAPPPPERAEVALRRRIVRPGSRLAARTRELLEVETDGVTSADTGALAGVVSGSDGPTLAEPIPGAEVRLLGLDLVVTDEQGRFRFDELRPGSPDVFARASGWAPARLEGVIVLAGETTRVELVLEPAGTGFVDVVSPAGAPVSDASVRLYPGGRRPWRFSLSVAGIRAVTGPDGRARVEEVRPGRYYGIVEAPPHPVWRGDLRFEEEGDVARVDLEAGGAIAGRVLASDGRPGRGHVSIGTDGRHAEYQDIYPVERVALDSDGEFRIEGVPEGGHHLAAILTTGEVALTEDPIPVTSGETTSVVLQATATATVRGRVTDPEGRPLAGIHVEMSKRAGLYANGTSSFPSLEAAVLDREAWTDDQGHYRLHSIRTTPFGRVKLSIDVDGFARAKEYPRVRAGETTVQDFELLPLDSYVAGRVTASVPLDLTRAYVNVKVVRGPGKEATRVVPVQADGRFRAAVPRGCEVDLVLSTRDVRPRCDELPSAVVHDVEAGTSDVAFRLVPLEYFRVRAVDERGRAIQALEISLFDDVSQRSSTSFEESHDGLYEVPVDLERDLFATLCAAGFEPLEVWDLECDDDEVRHVTLSGHTEDRSVRVVDALGEPIPGAAVSVAWYGERGAYPAGSTQVPAVRVDDAGEGRLRGVPVRAPCDFLVAPGRSDAPPLIHVQGLEVTRSGDGFVLEVPACPRVEITLTRPDGRPSEGRSLVVSEELPMTPQAFGSLRELDAPEAEDPGGTTGGELVLYLEPGPYQLHHRAPNAPAGAIRTFEFTVGSDGPNRFRFDVEG